MSRKRRKSLVPDFPAPSDISGNGKRRAPQLRRQCHPIPPWKAFAQAIDIDREQVRLLPDLELVVVLAIFGWWYFRRRHEYIKDFTDKIYGFMNDYHKNLKSHDQLVSEIKDLKREFDNLVLSQKVNYSEASFFYGFLDDKVRAIEIAREINESFLKLVDAFLDDNVLTESEYAKLNQFLNSIKLKIPTPQYVAYKKQIDEIYQQFGGSV